MNMIVNPITRITNATAGNIYFSKRTLPAFDFRWAIDSHGGTWNLVKPHNASLNINDWAEKFTKGPPRGISPCNLFEDTLKDLRFESASKDLGITPERLFADRFNDVKLTKPPIDSGMEP